MIDSIHENGAKLVTIKEEQLADFRFSYPGLRIIPEKFYRRAYREEILQKEMRSSGRAVTSFKTQITITGKNKAPLPGVYVVAFTDFATERATQVLPIPAG